MTTIVDLAREKRSRAALEERDCRLWTVEDAVVDFLQAIRSLSEEDRPTKLILIAENDAALEWERYVGMKKGEIIATLELKKFDVIMGDEDD